MRSTALNARSEYGLDGSLVRVDALLDRAREWKMNAAGLVDRASLLGIPHFLSGAHRRGLRVLLGVELPLLSSVAAEAAQGVCYPLVIHATSPESLGRLARLVTRARQRGVSAGAAEPYLRAEDLGFARDEVTETRAIETREGGAFAPLPLDGLIAQSPGQTGEVSVRILRGQMDLAEWLALRLAEVFGRSFFFLGVSLVEGRSPVEGRGAGEVGSEVSRAQFRLADATIQLARRVGLPVVASNTVDYLDAADAPAHEQFAELLRRRRMGPAGLLAASAGLPAAPVSSGRAGWVADGRGHLRTPVEFERLFRHHTEALEGLDALAERALLDPGLFHADAGTGSSSVNESSVREAAAQSRLAERVARACVRHRIGAAERRALHDELAAVRGAGLSLVLLRLTEAMEAGRRREGGWRDEGERRVARMRRGPVRGSLVAYRLGLTDVDPREAGLRFSIPAAADEGRALEPTLIEIAEEDQAAWLGSLDVSEVARPGLLSRVTRYDVLDALRDVGLASGVPTDLVRQAAVALDRSAGRAEGSSRADTSQAAADPIAAAFRNDPHLARAYQRDERVRVWFDTARRIVGFPRSVSVDPRTRILGLLDADATPGWFPSLHGAAVHPSSSEGRGLPEGHRSGPSAPPVLEWTGEHPEFGGASFSRPFTLIRVVAPQSYELRFLPAEGRADHGTSPRKSRSQKSSNSESSNSQSAGSPVSSRLAPSTGDRFPTDGAPEDSMMSSGAKSNLAIHGASGTSPSAVVAGGSRGLVAGAARRHYPGAAPVPTLHDVTEAIALERLAPLRPGLAERFVRRRRGEEAFQVVDAALKPVLAATFGLLVYEEQVVDIAVRVAAFSAAEAERLRREIAAPVGLSAVGGSAASSSAVGGSARGLALANWRVRFVKGAVERGCSAERAEEIFAGLVSAGAVTVSRSECVTEAMRILRESRGFGAARDGRTGATLPPGVMALPLPRRQFVLPWLEAPAEAVGAPQVAEEAPLRRRA